jgi:chromosome segregation ATPase
MKAVVDEVQAARKAEREQHEQQQHQHQQQPGLDKLLQQMAQLQATVSQLQQDKQMLLQQQQQQQQGGTVEGQDDLVKAKQQLHSSRRKVQQLTQARDKLEIILHDFEASAAEERQQLETQLAAANQAERKATNQLADVTEQLKQAQQQLAEALEQQQQQVDSLQQQLQEQQRQQQAEAQPLMDEAADSITHVAPADCTGRAAAAGTAMQVGTRHCQPHRHRAWLQLRSSSVHSSSPGQCKRLLPCACRLVCLATAPFH